MGIEETIRKILMDIEKLKEPESQSDVLDEIQLISLDHSLAVKLTIQKTDVHEFIQAMASTAERRSKKESSPLHVLSVIMSRIEQESGTFLVGTAKVGYSEAA